MAPTSSSQDSSRQIGAALLIGSAALLILGLQPILLGELVDKRVITLEGVGIVAMGEIIALGAGVALGDALLPLSRYRLIAAAAALFAAALDAATLFAASDGGFLAVRAAAGLAEGVLVWAATATIIRTQRPDRLAAIFMVAQTLSQAGMALLLAWFAVPRGGWQGGFQVLAAVTLFAVLAAVWLPRGLIPLAAADESAETGTWRVARVLPLGVAFLQMSAIGSLWAYMEPLGLRVGFDARTAQTVVSGVLFLQVLGGLAAVWLIRRSSPVLTLGIGGTVLGAVAGGIYLLPPGSTIPFLVLSAVFGFAWLFLMPFHIGLALRAAGRGRVAMLIPAAQLVGSAFGPLVASLVVEGDEAGPVPAVSLCFALGAAVLVLLGRGLWAKSGAAQAEAVAADTLEPAV